VKFKRIPIVY